LLEVSEALGVAGFVELQRIGEALVPGIHIERRPVQRGGVQATGITVMEHEAPVRHWHEIRELIEKARAAGVLPAGATTRALEAFEAIARAEATVHGCDIERVHFHEVGAADSIIDICFSSFLLDRLAPEAVFATPLALGSGSFVCSHGELPVPAPATALLIKGLPAYAGPHDGELTTPTGATLARCFVSAFEPVPGMRPTAVGYGAGSRVLPGAANVVRLLAGERTSLTGLASADDAGGAATSTAEADATAAATDTDDASGVPTGTLILEGCTLLETNIDHLSPEALAFACEELLAAGALDVWQEPITMKKGRLAVRLCVLTSAGAARTFTERVIALTGSLGVRSACAERLCAPRATATEQTPWGSVTFKTALVATPDGRVKLHRPEYEDVARLAREHSLDFNRLYEQLMEGEGLGRKHWAITDP
jgi:uncharacterized protein (TIGR00299 family) protein